MENFYCIESLENDIDMDDLVINIEVPSMLDPALLTDSRVLENMLNDELTVTKQDYCSSVQSHIAPHMRKIVTDWMLEVCEDQQCQPEVFFLSVNYLDRFLSTVNIKKNQFQLCASVCILLASKFSQVVPISTEKLVIYTDNHAKKLWQEVKLIIITFVCVDYCQIIRNPMNYFVTKPE